MITRECRYATERLRVDPWHEAEPDDAELVKAVRSLLSPMVTVHLPPGWAGLDAAGPRSWIAMRDAESTMLLAREAETGETVGLVILGEIPVDGSEERVDVRLGYIVGDRWQGRGLATEVVSGLVEWCRDRPVRSVAGGVSAANVASSKVLERAGFTNSGSAGGGEDLWEIRLD